MDEEVGNMTVGADIPPTKTPREVVLQAPQLPDTLRICLTDHKLMLGNVNNAYRNVNQLLKPQNVLGEMVLWSHH